MIGEGTSQERRAAPRYRCSGEAEVFLPNGGPLGRGQITDLSTGGCCVHGKFPLWKGAQVEVWARVRGTPLRVAATVACHSEERVGLRFHGLNERKLDQIRLLIEELSQSEKQMVKNARELAVSRRAEEKRKDCR